MKKTKSILIALVAVLLGAGIGANAQRGKGLMVDAKSQTDTAVVAISDTANARAVNADFKAPEHSVVDEVIWVVGDEPILKSDVEMTRLQGEAEGVTWHGDPDCAIPEQIAVQKLFLHQAAIDSIEVTEGEIAQNIDMQINRWIQQAGSKEKLEEYKRMTVAQMRSQLHDDFKNNQLIQQMKEKLVSDITVTPSDVRNYFRDMPEDSIPFVPTEVEVEIITRQPKIEQDEINRVKNDLRDYTDRVNKGEASFGTLARL